MPLSGRRTSRTLATGGEFDLVLSVTVLQHILDPAALRAALERMAQHLAPDGRAGPARSGAGAPRRGLRHCRSSVRASARRICSSSGSADLSCAPSPALTRRRFKTWLLPHLPRLSPRVRLAALAARHRAVAADRRALRPPRRCAPRGTRCSCCPVRGSSHEHRHAHRAWPSWCCCSSAPWRPWAGGTR